MVGGTIIRGEIHMADSYGSSISNLGVDVHSYLVDGIDTGSNVPNEQHRLEQSINNVTILGSGKSSSYHGIRIQGGSHLQIDNVRVYRMAHGIAVRGSYVNISNIYTEDCRVTSIIVKSATETGDAENVNISNVIAYNTGAYSAGNLIDVQSYHAGTSARFVNISNITLYNPSHSAVVVDQIAGTVESVNISNVTVYASGAAVDRGVFEVRNGATDVSFSNIQSYDPLYTSMLVRNDGTNARVRVVGAYSEPEQYLSGAYDYAQVGASEQLRLREVSGVTNYTVTQDDRIVVVSTADGNVTIDLPDLTQCRGCTFLIKKVDGTNAVTIDPYGAQVIDGAPTFALSLQWSFIEITSDGDDTWIITGH